MDHLTRRNFAKAGLAAAASTQFAAARTLELQDGHIVAAVLRDGERVTGDSFILAVPHWRVAELLPTELSARPEIARLATIETSPISSVPPCCMVSPCAARCRAA